MKLGTGTWATLLQVFAMLSILLAVTETSKTIGKVEASKISREGKNTTIVGLAVEVTTN